MRVQIVSFFFFGMAVKSGICLQMCDPIPEEFMCNGIVQCFFGEDERNCPKVAVEPCPRKGNPESLMISDKLLKKIRMTPESKVSQEELKLFSTLVTLKMGLLDYENYLEAEKLIRNIVYEAQMKSIQRSISSNTPKTEATIPSTTMEPWLTSINKHFSPNEESDPLDEDQLVTDILESNEEDGMFW